MIVFGLGHATKVDDIRKQYKNIDVLVIVDDIHVIIEDKTYTKLHGSQIDEYTKTLVKEGVPKDKIRTVFYKIIEQSKKEHVDCEFTRPRILCLLRKYKSCNNAIFTSYLDHLEELEARTQAYHQKKVEGGASHDLHVVGALPMFADHALSDRNEYVSASLNPC